LAADLGVADASTDESTPRWDWLAGRQEAIETKLVRTHLAGAAKTLTGSPCSTCPRPGSPAGAARCGQGVLRDGKKGLPQIE